MAIPQSPNKVMTISICHGPPPTLQSNSYKKKVNPPTKPYSYTRSAMIVSPHKPKATNPSPYFSPISKTPSTVPLLIPDPQVMITSPGKHAIIINNQKNLPCPSPRNKILHGWHWPRTRRWILHPAPYPSPPPHHPPPRIKPTSLTLC